MRPRSREATERWASVERGDHSYHRVTIARDEAAKAITASSKKLAVTHVYFGKKKTHAPRPCDGAMDPRSREATERWVSVVISFYLEY